MITDLYNKNFDFAISFKENEVLPKMLKERWFSPMDRSLRRELKPDFWNLVRIGLIRLHIKNW